MESLYVVATDPDTGEVMCSCGARAEAKDRRRFLSRHPKLCSERRRFSQQLANGTRSVDDQDKRERRDKQERGPGRVGLV
jgi:hypothetical protein